MLIYRYIHFLWVITKSVQRDIRVQSLTTLKLNASKNVYVFLNMERTWTCRVDGDGIDLDSLHKWVSWNYLKSLHVHVLQKSHYYLKTIWVKGKVHRYAWHSLTPIKIKVNKNLLGWSAAAFNIVQYFDLKYFIKTKYFGPNAFYRLPDTHTFVQQLCVFFFHYSLATSTTNWGLLFYALCWDTLSENTGHWQLPKVSSAFKQLYEIGARSFPSKKYNIQDVKLM